MSSLLTTVRSEIMETKESNPVLGYGEPPWLFRGRALYQVHLVKAETARAFIPKEFKLVEAFGYTLGGFFLANYEDSPAGIFDELVVIAGTVWNPPTSCAWAARVLVSSDKACDHGRKDVGLPSQVANFTKRVAALPLTKKNRFHDFLQNIGMTGSSDKQKNETSIQVKEKNDHIPTDFCSINLPFASEDNLKKWMGPPVKMSLPSFSGLTEHNPHLLNYSCQIECRLRVVGAVKLSGPTLVDTHGETSCDIGGSEGELTNGDDSSDYKRNLSISLMLSKPILALEFNRLTMKVEAPTVVPQR